MENATHALIMAFSVMVLVIALTVSIVAFNSVKQTADIILYTKDETNYYEYQGARGKQAENRIVGLETVIPTLYKYYKENYTVVFRKANDYTNTGEFSNVQPFELYETPSRYSSGETYLWGARVNGKNYSTYDLNMYKKYNNYINENNVTNGVFSNVYDSIGSKKGNKSIFSFDLEEETLRHEPWTGSNDTRLNNQSDEDSHDYSIKGNLDCFLSGKTYYNPSNDSPYIEYGKIIGTGGFTEKYKTAKFVETIAEYKYQSSQVEESTAGSLTKEKSKRMIIFTLITN